ncbi:MAG: cytochrome P450 [Caldilineaceae bacterium]
MHEQHFVDPEKFWPDRWLAGCPRHGAHDRGASLPFGSGPRLCPAAV